MITLLRRLRQQFISNNQFSKYLLYAIGEILLVMIGILLALQVNNWNQKQQNKAIGAQYLQRISADLVLDTTILDQKIQLANKLSKEYLKFLSEMYEVQRNKGDYISLLSSTEWNVDELILTDIAYSEMVNSGKLDLINNNKLINEITLYYRNYEFVASRVRELNSSNIHVLNDAGLRAPNLKYSLQGYLGMFGLEHFSKNDFMFNKSDWAYINTPASIEFRLLEEAVYYYYMKQVLIKPMFIDLKNQAKNILEQLIDQN